jgi:hypothetical protein
MVRWNIVCPTCASVSYDVECSMFAIPECESCNGERFLSNQGIAPKSRVFPFEARHVSPDGKPIIIESMKHLRDIERTHGVVFSAFNNEVNNSVDPMKGDLPKYRGDEPDIQRAYKKR